MKMDIHLPGTPVAINMEDDIQEILDSRPGTAANSRPISSTTVRSVSTPRPPTGRSSAQSRAARSPSPLNMSPNPASSQRPASSVSSILKSISPRSTPSPRPPTGSRPGTSESKKSARSKSGSVGSGSSGSSMGSRLSLSNCDGQPEGDTEWRTKLRLNCFVPHLDDKYVCPACSYVLYYPVQLSNCDHQLCSSCLSEVMKGTRCCPQDRKQIDRSQVLVRRDFCRELNALKLTCPQNDVGCEWTGSYEQFREHYSACEHAELPCPNGCGYRGEKRFIDNHVMKECQLRMVTCEFCARAIRSEKEIEHLKQCPRFPISCQSGCDRKQIPREEMTKHIEEECPFGEKKCPFNRLGCYVSGTREFITRHIVDDLTNHLELLCLGLDDYLQRINTNEEIITKHSISIEENSIKVANLLRMQGCQMLWKIDNWAQRVVEANTGKKNILRSPPFFTGRYGYKLALTLMPNGDGKAKGKSLSLYVCVCKGEYDALARWPFSMTVTLTLIDQAQEPLARADQSFVLRPNPCKENLPFLGRPTTNANPSFGAQSFVPLDMLETRDYVRDDVIFIKVLVESDV